MLCNNVTACSRHSKWHKIVAAVAFINKMGKLTGFERSYKQKIYFTGNTKIKYE